MSEETTQQTVTETTTTSTPDVEKLTGALQKEREQRSAYEKQARLLQQQLKAFEGVDPELARKAKEVLQSQQEWEEREAKLRSEVDAQYKPKLSEYENQIQNYQKQLTQSQQELLNYRRDTILEREFVRSGGFEGEFEDVAYRLQTRTRVNPETGDLEVLDSSGKRLYSKDDPGKPATVSDLIKELQKESIGFARHFKGSESGGAGINGSGRGGAGGGDWDKLPAWERVNAMRQQQGKV